MTHTPFYTVGERGITWISPQKNVVELDKEKLKDNAVSNPIMAISENFEHHDNFLRPNLCYKCFYYMSETHIGDRIILRRELKNTLPFIAVVISFLALIVTILK